VFPAGGVVGTVVDVATEEAELELELVDMVDVVE